MKESKNEKNFGVSIFINEIKYSSLLIYQQGNSDFAQLSKMQKYANSKRLSSAT